MKTTMDNMLNKMFVAVMAMIAVLMQAVATTHEVGTVADLKSALDGAAAGDTIVITTSLTPSSSDFTTEDDGTKSFLTVAKDNLIIMGADESSRKTWEQGAEPVIINCGSVGRFLQNNGSNLTVKNITVTGCNLTAKYGTVAQGGSCTFTNCVIRQNGGTRPVFWSHANFHLDDCAYISNAPQLVGYLRGCDISNNTSKASVIYKMYDCTFSGHNMSGNLISFVDGNNAVASNCVFKANKGTSGIFNLTTKAKIMDCEFVNNTNSLVLATLTEASDPVVISGCTFTSNVVDTSLEKFCGVYVGCCLIRNETNNFASAAAAQSRFLVNDTSFEGSCYQANPSTGNPRGMAEVFGVTATGCTFGGFGSCYYDPPKLNTFAMSAWNSRLECCDISGGDLYDCVVDRCTLHDIGSPAYACFRDGCRVTNSLVTNCRTYLFGALSKHDAEFVNCTFASNNAKMYRSQCAVGSANDFTFVNSLFNSNTNGSGTETDFSMENEDSTLNCWTSKVTFDHCFYGKFTATAGRLTDEVFAAKTNGVDTLTLCENPIFVKDSRPEAPYWSLSHKSPLLGNGDASIWTAEDIDLAGKLRLKDGQVDPGCYQCWLRAPGMQIIVR